MYILKILDAQLNSKPKKTLLEPNAYVEVSNTTVVAESLSLESPQQRSGSDIQSSLNNLSTRSNASSSEMSNLSTRSNASSSDISTASEAMRNWARSESLSHRADAEEERCGSQIASRGPMERSKEVVEEEEIHTEKFSTKIAERTLQPTWNQNFQLTNVDQSSSIRIEVKHDTYMPFAHDPILGRVEINALELKELCTGKDRAVTTLILKPVDKRAAEAHVKTEEPGTIVVSLRDTDEPVDLADATAPEVIKGALSGTLEDDAKTIAAHRSKRVGKGIEVVKQVIEIANGVLEGLN